MKTYEEKILEATYRLFKLKGVRSINLRHVARACGVGLPDIKLKFKSTKELVLAVVGFILNKKSAYLLINSSLSPSAVAELNNFFKFIDDIINELGGGTLIQLRRYHPVAFDQFKEWADMSLMPYLQRIIERGLREGFYRDDLNYELYVLTYFFVLRSVLENESHDWEEARRRINYINDIFLHGALNVKGMHILRSRF